MDDISTDRDVVVLLDIFHDTSPESRAIVTSRDMELLNSLDAAVYEVPFLDKNDSRQLFMSHAFPDPDGLPDTLLSLLERILEKCEGLPLTLEVLGKFLKGKKTLVFWEQTLAALLRAEAVQPLNERLWAKLRPSYDGLGEKEKQMFLDVATFFSKDVEDYYHHFWTLQDAKVCWREAYETTSETLSWQTLVDRSLVYAVEEDDNIIKMHEQLRSLGRKIASECRVWEATEALRLLQGPDQTEHKELHSCRLGHGRYDKVICVSDRGISKLKNALFLEFGEAIVIDRSVEDESLPIKVVLLKCVGLKVLNPALQNHVAILHLDLNNELLPASIGKLSALRHLVLSNAQDQENMPDEIGHLSQLERLTLVDWCSLQNLPETLGNLGNLNHLRLNGCSSLQNLPETFGKLGNLRDLHFDKCESLHSLPETSGDLVALERLTFSCCSSLEALPESFGNLLALRHLDVSACDALHSLPESFGHLSALLRLELDGCNALHVLPASFGQLVKLEHLSIRNAANLLEIRKPLHALAQHDALHHLSITGIPMESIPGCINSMRSLQSLEIGLLPFVKELPQWLDQASTVLPALSHKKFSMEEGCFVLTREHSAFAWNTPDNIIALWHQKAVRKVRGSDYDGALADFGHMDIALPDIMDKLGTTSRAFSRQERGIARHLVGDFVEDLTSAVEMFCGDRYFNEEGYASSYAYDCLKHRGYAKFSLGDMRGAQRDGEMALQALSEMGYQSVMPPSLGENPVTYMHFKLKSRSRIIEDRKLCVSSHSQVMEKVREADFQGALVMWENFNARVAGYHEQAFFLLERGIIKRLLGDLYGALEDLTEASAVGVHAYAYNCFRHRGYVKYLMGDRDGARSDGRKALKLVSDYKFWNRASVGDEPLIYMQFRLKGRKDILKEERDSPMSQVKENVRRSDFQRALAMWDDFNARVSGYHDEGLFLLVKGTLKRLLGELLGADLTAASEILEDYNCLKQLGYVKYLMGDEDGARKDGTIALKWLSLTNRLPRRRCVGDETIIYMQFRLKGSDDIEKERRDLPHSQVMKKVQTSECSEALAIWDAFDSRVSGYHDQGFFLQERAILKRLVGDLHGALQDLTTSLEMDPDDYECSKHRGYVKFLLGDTDGARIDAKRCLTMGLKEASDHCLGTHPVAFLEFTL